MYSSEEGREQVKSGYRDTSALDQQLLRRTQANYSAEVTMCDRWFGYLMETLRVLGMLDNTMVILTSDHGHSIGDHNYIGKRGYPSATEVYDIPLMIRFPGAENGGKQSDLFVQHHDISAAILDAVGIQPEQKMDGLPFLQDALSSRPGLRDHVTVGWGSAVTVITRKWWFNGKVDGTGVLLYDLEANEPFSSNVADGHADVVRDLFARAEADAEGGFPEWVVDLAKNKADAPGCSDLAARS
jgi:arylsulfatase A-like enzyme